MDDRELLELAATAAGIQGAYRRSEASGHWGVDVGDLDGVFWNPLVDDGDALRLAVQLGIDLQHFVVGRMVEAWRHPYHACGEDYGEDPSAATRRAIVRAAAAMAPKTDARDPGAQS